MVEGFPLPLVQVHVEGSNQPVGVTRSTVPRQVGSHYWWHWTGRWPCAHTESVWSPSGWTRPLRTCCETGSMRQKKSHIKPYANWAPRKIASLRKSCHFIGMARYGLVWLSMCDLHSHFGMESYKRRPASCCGREPYSFGHAGDWRLKFLL